MKRIFITYGNQGFEKTKKRIIEEARFVGVFDEIYAYGPEDVSEDVLCKQAVRATRLRTGEKETFHEKVIGARRWVKKNFFLLPFCHAPLHWWYSHK